MKIHFLITLGMLGPLALASAQTIPNPSFELNSFTNWPGSVASNSPIVGWTTTDTNHAGLNPVSGTNNPFADNGTIPDGNNVAFIQSSASSSLSTVISNLTVGENYKVNFRVNASSNNAPNLNVDIAGVNIIETTVAPVGGSNSYQYFAFDFTATDVTNTLKLRNDAGGNNTVLLDNFSIGVRNSGWSYDMWLDDASSGVDGTKIYTHAYNFGSTNGTTINGITFTGIAGPNPAVPNSFSTTGLTNVLNNDANNVSGASAVLAHDFLYGGSPESITLYGLVPGKSYQTTIYSVAYENGAPRAATFSVGNDRLTVNQDQFGVNFGIRVSYNFTASSSSITLTYIPLRGSGQSFYTYGFFNCEVPPVQLVNPSFEADTFTLTPGYATNNFPITGWNGVGGYGVNPGTFGHPFLDNGAIPDGTKVAFIQSDGALTQLINGFAVGASYQVAYFENARICCSGTLPYAEVRIGGQTIVAPHPVLPVGGVNPGNPYHQVLSDVFVATNSSLELAFVKSNPQGGDTTLFIDDVSLRAAPLAVTLAADQIVQNSARLNGQANPHSLPTLAWFQWGTDTNYGNVTAPQDAGSGSSLSNLNAVLNGLLGQQYHYQLVASNAFGIAAGTDQVFSMPGFYSISIPFLPGVQNSSVAWGDFDNDGRLDFLIMGDTGGGAGSEVCQLWLNMGSGFTNVTASVAPTLPGANAGWLAWGDYNNDGRLDFLLTGNSPISGGPISQLWRNSGSGFTYVPIPSVPLGSSLAWGDFDNDGRLDFLITGSGNSQLWRNTGNGFTNVPIPGLLGFYNSSVAWGDFDNDGRLDFLITGITNNSIPTPLNTPIAQLWRNTGSGFTNVPVPGLQGVAYGSVAWGDFDNDGRLDFLITGDTNFPSPFPLPLGPPIAQLWQNTGSGFTNVPVPGLQGVRSGSVAWGDFDNDGRLDFLLTGTTNGFGNGPISQLWRNTGSGFTNVPIPGLQGVYNSSVAWGDFDNDGRLDFLLTGNNGSAPISQLWRNNLPGSNAPPAAPAGLSATLSGNTLNLNWTAPADDHTPAAGLNYNVRIGTTPGGSDIVAPQALASGTRLVPQIGNAGPGLTTFYALAPGQDYYWSVQAVDTSFAGSPFAAEQVFTIGPLLSQPLHLGNGVFQFTFTNSASGTWEVRGTTNLALPVASWDNLGLPLQVSGNVYQFNDGLAPMHPQRYYLLQKQ